MATSDHYEHRGPSVWHCSSPTSVRAPIPRPKIEKAISAEIERVKTDGITDEELEKIRMRDNVRGRRPADAKHRMGRAMVALGQFAVYLQRSRT